MLISREVIRKENGKWYLYTADGTRRLGGPYDTEKEALNRERQVQFFKHQKEGEAMPKNFKKEKGVEVPKNYKPPKAEVILQALGLEEQAGNIQGLVDTFDDWAGGSVAQCISQLEGKEGIEDAATLCAWMKDQSTGTTAWRGEAAEVAEMGVYDEVKVGPTSYPTPMYIPSQIITFGDLTKEKDANKVARTLLETNQEFIGLVQNILWSSKVEDKVKALYALVYEYSAQVLPAVGVTSGIEEAATVKNAVKAAVKALNSLLQDKTLPQGIIRQVEALRETFRKTWKDLEVEAEGEGGEEEETEEAQEDAAEEEDDSPVAEKVSESFHGMVTMVSEAAPEPTALDIDVVLIQPGWGNTRNNHFYTAEMLRGNAHKFLGAKMFETDHKPGEKSTRTWVSTITDVRGFTSDGAPIVRASIHDPDFAQRVINLNSKGLLEKMECSILADAVAERKVYSEGSRQGKKIVEILNVDSVDWVTRAGAGGHVHSIAESEEGTHAAEDPPIQEEPIQEQGEKVMLTEVQVKEVLGKTRLPQASQDRLVGGSYEDEAALEAVITAEVEYLKVITASGKPFSLGESQAPAPEKVSEADVSRALDEIDQKFGITPIKE